MRSFLKALLHTQNEPSVTVRALIKSLTPPIALSLVRAIRASLRSDKQNGKEQGFLKPNHSQFHYENTEAFQCLYHDYFVKEKYKFDTTTPKPFIIDGGANIGVGCRYWKFLYPQSEVIAFEPDENNFSLLQKNMTSCSGFKAEKKALWSSHGTLKFNAVGGEGGHVADTNSTADEHGFIEVPAFRLRDLLDRKVDLLKLDIEGGEMEVLRDCKDSLRNVERIFVEHHSFLGQPQQLGEFFGILENAGFRLNIHVDFQAPQPFSKRLVYNNKDAWLNIFGFRE
jgi:FkbM family methyltransferase